MNTDRQVEFIGLTANWMMIVAGVMVAFHVVMAHLVYRKLLKQAARDRDSRVLIAMSMIVLRGQMQKAIAGDEESKKLLEEFAEDGVVKARMSAEEFEAVKSQALDMECEHERVPADGPRTTCWTGHE